MEKMKSGLFSSLVLVIMFAFLTGIGYSQSDSTKTHKMESQKSSTMSMKYDKNVKEAANKLKTQVTLTMEQTKNVEGILQNYKDNNSSNSENNTSMSSSNNSTLDKIENLLTSTQKTKFDQIKDQWWSDTQKSLSSSTTTKKSSGTDKPKTDY